jgi:hypothetical protein
MCESFFFSGQGWVGGIQRIELRALHSLGRGSTA